MNHIVYAASEDGCVYAYNTRDALFMYCMRKHYGAITHADILGKVLYTVGLDARLQRCIEIDQVLCKSMSLTFKRPSVCHIIETHSSNMKITAKLQKLKIRLMLHGIVP